MPPNRVSAALAVLAHSPRRLLVINTCATRSTKTFVYHATDNLTIHRDMHVECEFCEEQLVTASGAFHHLEGGCCEKSNTNGDTLARQIQKFDIDNILTDIGEHNGGQWKCSLCSKGFRTRSALVMHWNSPAHSSKPYHCINRGCDKHFITLSALFQHLESESCGIAGFTQIPLYYLRLTDSIHNGEQITLFDFGR
ncbi:Zinc finger C2H2 [Penicillium brevicompactum]|uniref:Zinc finger C2H2 n=1 Tax=Penicillium brevicompactum TaxID=5074 RepID=A0A9W9QBI4_PENBR|nr:Zinc finger C2H2 [Penicillium brevicompactum]